MTHFCAPIRCKGSKARVPIFNRHPAFLPMQGPDSSKNVAISTPASGYEYPQYPSVPEKYATLGYSYPEAELGNATFLRESGPCMGTKARCLLKKGTQDSAPMRLIGAQNYVTLLALKHCCRAVVLRSSLWDEMTLLQEFPSSGTQGGQIARAKQFVDCFDSKPLTTTIVQDFLERNWILGRVTRL